MLEIYGKEYSIGDVADILKEELHNLRYWQKELGLPDRRNELNQRIYNQADINTFRFIKELREKENLSLKAIKKILQKAEIVKEEVAATSEVAVVNNNYMAAVEALERLREDLLSEIDTAMEKRNSEIKEELEDLKDRMDFIELRRSQKMDDFIAEWRLRNQKKGFFQKIFK
jgi:DNA-binding transcriptional MerR regulator